MSVSYGAYELMNEGVAVAIRGASTRTSHREQCRVEAPRTIQGQLGHASLATTDTYLAHIAPKVVIETIGKRQWSP